jgi:hypothetical protein
VTRIKFLHHLAIQLESSARELCESPDYRDGLARWKELHVLCRQIAVELDYLENVLKIQYHEQTRLRAVSDLWKKLNSEILEKDTPTPPQKLVKRKKL